MARDRERESEGGREAAGGFSPADVLGSLGEGLPWQFALVLLAVFALFVAVRWLWRRRRRRAA